VLIFPAVIASYLILFDAILNQKWFLFLFSSLFFFPDRSREHVFIVALMLAVWSYGPSHLPRSLKRRAEKENEREGQR